MTDSAPFTVAVLGPGGVGGLLAALLARAGHRVICLAGEPTAATLLRTGISVRSAQFGDFTAKVEADTELTEPVDLCLITCKQTALEAALRRVPPAAVDDGLIVPLLNGVEHPDLLCRRFRPELVAPAVIRVESTRVAPGLIEHGSPFTDIDLAGDAVPPERLDAVAAMLNAAGVRTKVQPDQTATLWRKMSFLAPMALLTTRHGLSIGELRSARRQELLELVEETTTVGRAFAPEINADAVMRAYDDFLPETKSSMQRDAEAARPLELDAIGGALLRAADRQSVQAPITRRLVTELTALARSTAP
ncbi:ketopantoate reductase family protein [Actinomadura nitritigenes]|uniref:2-dehydropantoate 2-reductase n=1 Tax=Actinomadura nitritigenes TaxID=134602 RepID=A0ABS3R9H2_9ACTN|nr:2-dehydropantoate 2-reductase [Actinomadura nitritigenes]MBO2442858.1 2-dehydropantoate 2-reductase [Actinomadura nitritigenes]